MTKLLTIVSYEVSQSFSQPILVDKRSKAPGCWDRYFESR